MASDSRWLILFLPVKACTACHMEVPPARAPAGFANRHSCWRTRPPTHAGTAALLHALAGQLSAEELHAALDFLLGQGLADPDQDIRDGMVAAGGHFVFRTATSSHWHT